MEETKKRKQMAFDINPEIHHKVKFMAAVKNISVNLWVQRAILREINRQERNENDERNDDKK